ncbi:2OG-Fe(II) oxygenase [Streptomyces sp. NBC_01283]|uniref:2OG-Fe(II) oxygenase n=1 Tax=Streptomyces sp. NBC_01283 TaxID=2903812 RepID=UPI00352CCB1C
MANQWAPRLGERTFPPTLDELSAECAANGQRRPTPLILNYGEGDYACLHQDIYGDIVFPHRPVPGRNGYRRHPMRHGTNAVESGHRNTLGVIFHNAR